MEKNKFEFADFKVSSQEWNVVEASSQIVNGCSDNGREFWSSEEKDEKESE